ncbi:MAG: MEDS domain-containing protein [Marinisporobacter sp.]|nr:MEDS domain-containing protein [Marinisporobacter sp.]
MKSYDATTKLCGARKCVKKEIEVIRKKLNNLVVEKNEDLLDPEVLKLSEELDELIVKYNRTHKKDCIINLYNISGIHSTFYYYGENHLFTNMIQYIDHGIKNKEIIHISMKPELYDKLLKFLSTFEIPQEHIKFYPVKELILSNKTGGLDGLKKKVAVCTKEALEKGYGGIRWIGQPTYAIQETSKDDFLSWEINLTEALQNTKVSLICIYDYYDYINDKKVIDERVINESLNTHSHVLNKFYLENI